MWGVWLQIYLNIWLFCLVIHIEGAPASKRHACINSTPGSRGQSTFSCSVVTLSIKNCFSTTSSALIYFCLFNFLQEFFIKFRLLNSNSILFLKDFFLCIFKKTLDVGVTGGINILRSLTNKKIENEEIEKHPRKRRKKNYSKLNRVVFSAWRDRYLNTWIHFYA